MYRAEVETVAKRRELFRLGFCGEDIRDGIGPEDIEAVDGMLLVLVICESVRTDGISAFHDISSFLSVSLLSTSSSSDTVKLT